MNAAVAALTVALLADVAHAVVLCAKPKKDGTYSTSVKIREACKLGETQLDPVALGLQGPAGPEGPPGPQGDPGNCECVTTTTVTSTTTTTVPTPRFTDNGDGTITDSAMGLMWEVKTNSGGLHDVDDTYPWSGMCSISGDRCQRDTDALARCPAGQVGCALCAAEAGACVVTDGQAGTDTIFGWVARLNATAFADHADWRVPKFTELTTLLAEPFPCNLAYPCVDPLFRNGSTSYTAPDLYWAETTHPYNPTSAWNVRFSDAFETWSGKTDRYFVRAVRDAP